MDGVIDSDTNMKTRVPLTKKTTAISVVLEDEIIAELDRTSIGMRLTTGRALNRSILIRAILTANLAWLPAAANAFKSCKLSGLHALNR